MSDGETLREQPVLGVESVGSVVVIRLAGELDLYNADQVRAALADAIAGDPSRVVADLTEVLFIDSTALGVLVEAHASVADGAFRLAAPQLEVRRALLVSGLDRKLLVDDTVDEALAID